MEGELFGYVDQGLVSARPPAKQAAGKQCRGRFEIADGGTLYLENIDALGPALQVKLLRVLEHGHISRVGGSKRIRVEVRLIVATSQRLAVLAEMGSFNEDLHDRLCPVTIEAPPLRARREDIPLLVNRTLEQAARQYGKQLQGISRNAMNLLVRYDWPGNLRELFNVIEGMVATAAPKHTAPGAPALLELNDIPEYVRRGAAPEAGEIRAPAGATMKEIERIAIEETMKACAYDKTQCARMLEIGLRTLYRKLKEYGIR